MHSTTDIVIPLSGESPYNNLELRFALRSVEKYVQDLGQVWILSTSAPDWLQHVKILPIPDRHARNKDANLFDKLLFASRMEEVAETFVFLSDDQAFLAPFRAETARPVVNLRGPGDFVGKSGVWARRMLATFDRLALEGIYLRYNYDAHVPVVYRKRDFAVLGGIDYAARPGYCINTLLCGLLGRERPIAQDLVKAHAETGTARPVLTGKLYAGYNNAGFPAMRELLRERFPEKSRYEKEEL